MKINPPKAAIAHVNAAQKARIEAAAAINKASEAVPQREERLATSIATLLEEGDRSWIINMLVYENTRDFLLTTTKNFGYPEERLAFIVRWLNGASIYDSPLAYRVQDAANRKYGDLYAKLGPDICLNCGLLLTKRFIMGGRISSSCIKCSGVYKRRHTLVLYLNVISQRMFISTQELTWRLACSEYKKRKVNRGN